MRKSITYLFWFLVIQVVCSYAVWTVWSLVGGTPLGELATLMANGKFQPSVNMMIAGTAVFGLVTILVFTLKKWAPLSRDYLRSHPWAVLFWCALIPFGTTIPSVWLQELMPELPDVMRTTFDGLLSRPVGYVFVGIVAPLVEELVFRGAILRVLLARFRKHWVAILLSAILFALIHFNPAQMPHAFLLGLLLGWLYYRTGSILPGVVVHWVNNSIAFVAFNLYPGINDMHLVDLFQGSRLHVGLSLLFSLFILLPAIYQIWLRTGRKPK